MVTYIKNVRLEKCHYCTCKYVREKSLCDICRFARNLWIFAESEIDNNKNEKIAALCHKLYKFICILNYWNGIKHEYVNYFDYSKKWIHNCL